MFSSLKLHTILPSGCSDLHFQQQCGRVPLSPGPTLGFIVGDFEIAILDLGDAAGGDLNLLPRI